MGVFAQQTAFSTPPSARQIGVERAHLTGVQVWAESSFDLRGLSFPGLFICRNHSGFPLLQIHLQEATPGGAHRGLFYCPGCPCSWACDQLPVSLHPGVICSLGAKACDLQQKTGSDKCLGERLEVGHPKFESWQAWGKAPWARYLPCEARPQECVCWC